MVGELLGPTLIDGTSLGRLDGRKLGAPDSVIEGEPVGDSEGTTVGFEDGKGELGVSVGARVVGVAEGLGVGARVVGEEVGGGVGATVIGTVEGGGGVAISVGKGCGGVVLATVGGKVGDSFWHSQVYSSLHIDAWLLAISEPEAGINCFFSIEHALYWEAALIEASNT